MSILDRKNLDRLVDLSPVINKVPNKYGLINKLGLFADEPKKQKIVEIPRIIESEHYIKDKNWGERNQAIAGEKRDSITVKIPHYPLDEAITVNDLDGVVNFESFIDLQQAVPETVASARARKMKRVLESHRRLLEMSRLQTIVDGTTYAPNGTVNYSWYDEWGVRRREESYNLSTTTSAPNSFFEENIQFIQESLETGQVVSGFVCLCGRKFFNNLTSNPFIIESAKWIRSPQTDAILLGRPVADVYGLDARYRAFEFAGILFISVVDKYKIDNIVIQIPDNEARLFPTGVTGLFRTMYAPAERFQYINQSALPFYWWEYTDDKDDRIEIMTESNFLNVIAQPQVVVKLTDTTTP